MGLLKTLRFINSHQLAKRHKIKAIVRFFKWQMSQLFSPGPVEYPFIGDTKLWVKKGMEGATGNIYTGLHEFEDMCFLLHFLRAEDLFIDIGANIGSYTILAAGVSAGSCISIEPIPQTYEILKKNVDINNLGNKVTALNIGMGSKNDILTFTKHLDSVNHVIPDSSKEDGVFVKVQCQSLDEVLALDQHPSLIKIDVEGFEQEVINGASRSLANPILRAIIIELNGSGNRYGYDEGNIHRQLKEYGFRSFNYDPFTRQLQAAENHGSLNTIYLRDMEFVKERLESANPVAIFSEKI